MYSMKKWILILSLLKITFYSYYIIIKIHLKWALDDGKCNQK